MERSQSWRETRDIRAKAAFGTFDLFANADCYREMTYMAHCLTSFAHVLTVRSKVSELSYLRLVLRKHPVLPTRRLLALLLPPFSMAE